jgi:predicted secreted protein
MAFTASAFTGTTFKIGSPLVAVSGVLEAPTISLKKETIDVTAIDDTSEQSIPDPLIMHDSFDVLLAYDKDNTQHMALLSAFNAGTTLAFQVLMGDGETFTGVGYVTQWAVAGAKKESSKRKISFKAAGAIVIA